MPAITGDIRIEIKINGEKSMKSKFSKNHLKILWCIQIVIASMYLLSTLTVNSNMQLLNLGPKASLFIIIALTALGAFDAIFLLLIDKKRRWISILLLLMYAFFSIPALV